MVEKTILPRSVVLLDNILLYVTSFKGKKTETMLGFSLYSYYAKIQVNSCHKINYSIINYEVIGVLWCCRIFSDVCFFDIILIISDAEGDESYGPFWIFKR